MKKDKTNLKIIVAMLITMIVTSTVSVFATIQISAKEIGYNNTTVADQLDSIYQTMFSDNYSTTERQVGKWIDGKPLYQKTYIISTPHANTNGTWAYSTTALGIENLDSVVYTNGISVSNNSIAPLPYISDGGYMAKYNINSAMQISVANNNSYINDNKIYVTIQYTKTTDQPQTN